MLSSWWESIIMTLRILAMKCPWCSSDTIRQSEENSIKYHLESQIYVCVNMNTYSDEAIVRRYLESILSKGFFSPIRKDIDYDDTKHKRPIETWWSWDHQQVHLLEVNKDENKIDNKNKIEKKSQHRRIIEPDGIYRAYAGYKGVVSCSAIATITRTPT